jgi:release factor glutamine methyltransferase
MTIQQFIDQARRALAVASPTPRLDAEVLLLHVCGLARSALVTRAHEALNDEQARRLDELLARRVRGEPLAYLTGEREFWSLPLLVTPDVLIPRPETELLVERALAHIPVHATWTVADLGTGSGAVALAIASERRDCRVIATDRSEHALAVARTNAGRLAISNVEFRHGEWFAPLAGLRCEVIVSNPPYVAEGDPHLSRGDLRFEPRGALVSGPDGLDAIRTIAAAAPAHLHRHGWLMIEHGYDQAGDVRAILVRAGFRNVASHADLGRHDRVTEAQI